MGKNIFTSFEEVAAGEGGTALWAARAPYRPEPGFDLMLIPRLPKGADWREGEGARGGLDRVGDGPGGGRSGGPPASPGGGGGRRSGSPTSGWRRRGRRSAPAPSAPAPSPT